MKELTEELFVDDKVIRELARKQILSGSPERLNERALKYLEIEIVDHNTEEGKIRLGDAMLTKKRLAYYNIDSKLCLTDGGRWNPVEDIRDAYQLEEKIKEMDLTEEYSIKLLELIDEGAELYDSAIECNLHIGKTGPDLLFAVAHATPEQKTKAFLIAYEETIKG